MCGTKHPRTPRPSAQRTPASAPEDCAMARAHFPRGRGDPGPRPRQPQPLQCSARPGALSERASGSAQTGQARSAGRGRRVVSPRLAHSAPPGRCLHGEHAAWCQCLGPGPHRRALGGRMAHRQWPSSPPGHCHAQVVETDTIMRRTRKLHRGTDAQNVALVLATPPRRPAPTSTAGAHVVQMVPR